MKRGKLLCNLRNRAGPLLLLGALGVPQWAKTSFHGYKNLFLMIVEYKK